MSDQYALHANLEEIGTNSYNFHFFINDRSIILRLSKSINSIELRIALE